MILLEQMLRTGRLTEFVYEFVEIVGEEISEEKAWEFYLHKVFDKSFIEYRHEIGIDRTEPIQPAKEADFEATIRKSMKIANSDLS